MRNLLLAAMLLLGLAPNALAQEANEQGLGPYRFGMTSAEVRATAPNASWTSAPASDTVVLTGGPRVAIGGRLESALVFVEDRLLRITLSGIAPGECPSVVASMVETVEPLYGPFVSVAPNALEEGRLMQVSRTEAGSEIRVRALDDERRFSVSARYGAMYVVVRGEYDSAGMCRVMLTLGPNTDWPRSVIGPGPTWAELDAAQSLPDPDYTQRPNARSFADYYPINALERGISGRVALDCLAIEDDQLNCRVSEEAPFDAGFAAAALGIARDFRVRQSKDGTPALGRRLRIPIRFNTSDHSSGSMIGP